jgi:hypothetical protein
MYNQTMEKKLFAGVLYLTIFLTICFILLTTYLQRRLHTVINWNSQPETQNITPGSLVSSPSPTPKQIVWNRYLDKQNGYSIEYPISLSPNEESTKGYRRVDFYSGCMKITSGTLDEIEALAKDEPVPWSHLDELKSLVPNQKATFVSETWSLGQGQNFDLTYTYEKMTPRTIGGLHWNTFFVLSNYENHGYLMQYFVERNRILYFISSLTYGPCWSDEPERMLNSFRFTRQ